MNTLIDKKSLNSFFDKLKSQYELFGPTQSGEKIIFDKIESFNDLILDKQTDYPPKKYFIPNNQELFKYENNKVKEQEFKKKRVVIMHPCDANGILCLDKVFLDENPDPYYKQRRENTLLFVFKCITACKNGFCASLKTDETTNYDLLFVDIGDKYVVSIGNNKAAELTKNKYFSPIIREGKIKTPNNRNLINVEKLEAHFDNPVWKEETEKCLSCNGCNIVCPTCYCFTIHDVPDLKLTSGKRERFWSYCHMKEHTKVAGGHVFREDRDKRFKHRIYHKLKYFKDQTGRQLCTGCGRCIDVCPAEIDMVKMINEIRD